MTIDELIKILENYEVFVDDDYGGSYKSVIAYAPDKKVSRAHTPIGTLKIIDTFEEIQKENQELKTQQKEFIEYLEDYIDALKQQKETVEGLDIGEEHILMILEEVLEKYKEITGVKDE